MLRHRAFIMPSLRPEARTRRELIDPALPAAGWDVNDPEWVRTELPVISG